MAKLLPKDEKNLVQEEQKGKGDKDGKGDKGGKGKGGKEDEKKAKKYPKYVPVGELLQGEKKKMTAGEREDYFVDNLAEFLQPLKKELKLKDLKSAIQTELNKMYEDDSEEKMLKFFNDKHIRLQEIIIWNRVAAKLKFMDHGEYITQMY